MSERVFSKVSPAIWRSSRFRGLGEPAQIAFFYLITNAHVTSAGVYVLPDGYACSDLGWTLDTYREVRAELVASGMIDHDPDHDTILIERWFQHNPPMNDSHAVGTRRYIHAIESERLRAKASDPFDKANAQRIEREAAKAAEREMRRNGKSLGVAATLGDTSRLTNSRFIRGSNG